MVFDAPDHRDHEQVTHFTDEETGLEAIISIHDTTLGPSLGGTRILDYDTEEEALTDVLRLSRAMTYKAAAADLHLGGGKAVIIGDPEEIKTDALMRAYGRAVDCLDGRYITSVDVNSGVKDMELIESQTDHVVGTSDGLGDPSPITAHGVLHGLKACVEHVYGTDTLSDIDVAVQGLGKVGHGLAVGLAERGASVTVTDINEDKMAEFTAEYDAEAVAPDDIYDVDCDVFAPCAFGGAINDDTLPRLTCDIVAGAANNILADEERHSEMLKDEGILYAPDYVINAGGLITVYHEHQGGTEEQAFEDAKAIGDRLQTMIERAEDEDITVLDAADAYAEERIGNQDRTTPARSW
ncbi:Leu/Phe/Val dehydrogenase [Halovenus rubra]|uniref:Leu/Phe/Val dehydrogenase n=2 Tax=Halovenus rubra TaxID=869890 RepID=A0ABD5XB79_9EURY|nr:Glu/Leu/Phe/Val dehydrogenase dimerization domain-containing protein [Halovenus rubra]